jgi:NADH-quinone oxidoreductase subunit M
MSQLHLPWLEIGILIPLIGALVVSRSRDPLAARRWAVVFSGAALGCTFLTWQDFQLLHTFEADDRWHLMSALFGHELFTIDELSAPLLPHIALLFFLTTLATLRTKIRRFSFVWTLASEALTLATFSCKDPWLVIGLLAAGTVPPYLELRARNRPTRVYALHMGLFVGLLLLGELFVLREGEARVHTLWSIVPLLLAVLIRSGIVPFHCWLTELFEHATFGSALLFAVPLAGAYAAMRLVLPIAPDWVLRSIGLFSLVTAVYAAGMALIQTEARRFFAYLFLSHSALVLVGLEMVTPIGLTGALCVWLSVGLSLGGFGLTLRALESRRGRLSLVEFQGLYEHAPALAICFLVTGLGSVGFPGTSGFVGTELLVDGAVAAYPYTGVAVVVAAALNGIALVQAYFRIFTGTRYTSMVSLGIVPRERFAVLTLVALILLGGLAPQFTVASRYHAAVELLNHRGLLSPVTEPPAHE